MLPSVRKNRFSSDSTFPYDSLQLFRHSFLGFLSVLEMWRCDFSCVVYVCVGSDTGWSLNLWIISVLNVLIPLESLKGVNIVRDCLHYLQGLFIGTVLLVNFSKM